MLATGQVTGQAGLGTPQWPDLSEEVIWANVNSASVKAAALAVLPRSTSACLTSPDSGDDVLAPMAL